MWQGGEREGQTLKNPRLLGSGFTGTYQVGGPAGLGSLDYANAMLPWLMKLSGGKLISEAIGH